MNAFTNKFSNILKSKAKFQNSINNDDDNDIIEEKSLDDIEDQETGKNLNKIKDATFGRSLEK